MEIIIKLQKGYAFLLLYYTTYYLLPGLMTGFRRLRRYGRCGILWSILGIQK